MEPPLRASWPMLRNKARHAHSDIPRPTTVTPSCYFRTLPVVGHRVGRRQAIPGLRAAWTEGRCQVPPLYIGAAAGRRVRFSAPSNGGCLGAVCGALDELVMRRRFGSAGGPPASPGRESPADWVASAARPGTPWAVAGQGFGPTAAGQALAANACTVDTRAAVGSGFVLTAPGQSFRWDCAQRSGIPRTIPAPHRVTSHHIISYRIVSYRDLVCPFPLRSRGSPQGPT